jgi:hypothetical protein
MYACEMPRLGEGRGTRGVVFALVVLWLCGHAAASAEDKAAEAGRKQAPSTSCAFSGPAKNLPRTPQGDLDFPALGTPKYIRILGCGGGGGGAGAGRAPNDGYAPSGSSGAGADVVSYLYGPISTTTKLPVSLTDDGAGGCGGATDWNVCHGVPNKPGARARNQGEPGHPGTTVRIGVYEFPGGDGGTVVEWDYSAGPAPSRAKGGQRAVPGGDGGTFGIGDASSGSNTSTHLGGKAGPRNVGNGGQGGIAGAGGGASSMGDGGAGGRAGAGDGKATGAANNAGDGQAGQACAGGGGGGGAAGGTFPGGNGGNGGEPWIIIVGGDQASELPADLDKISQTCPLPSSAGHH